MIAAVWMLLLRDGCVLLSRRRGTGYRDGWLSLVGGHLEDDESVRQGAVREAREEVGVVAAPEAVDVVSVVHRRADGSRVDFFTACRSWTGAPVNAEPAKCSELLWSPVRELPADVIPYMRTAVANYRAGVWFESLDWPEPPPRTATGSPHTAELRRS